eukprot:9024676-Karenia_brevis.AAC.1
MAVLPPNDLVAAGPPTHLSCTGFEDCDLAMGNQGVFVEHTSKAWQFADTCEAPLLKEMAYLLASDGPIIPTLHKRTCFVSSWFDWKSTPNGVHVECDFSKPDAPGVHGVIIFPNSSWHLLEDLILSKPC